MTENCMLCPKQARCNKSHKCRKAVDMEIVYERRTCSSPRPNLCHWAKDPDGWR